MTKRKHPDTNLTLREAYEKHYDKSQLSPRSRETYHYTFNCWERLTKNPPVGRITNEVLAEFRDAQLEESKRPATINGRWITIRSILRRLGPPITGNPGGLSIFPSIPYMRLLRCVHERPYRVPLDDLSRFYIACKFARYPLVVGSAPDWWRALLVLAYCTGLRRGDLLSIKMEDIDLVDATLDVTAGKTGKADLFPLHPAAVAHIERIAEPQREKLFNGVGDRGGRFDILWKRIMRAAKIKRPFTLHDIRRTVSSEVERVRSGLGRVMMQHSPRSVTDTSYLNMTEELGEAILKMRMPTGFKSGPKMADRAEAKASKERVQIHADEFHVVPGPNPADWKFTRTAFWFRGRWFRLSGIRLRLLRVLAGSSEPVGVPRLAPAVFKRKVDASDKKVAWLVQVEVAQLRGKLRRALGLEDGWDPIPCLERGAGGLWTIHIPPTLKPPEVPPVVRSPRVRTLLTPKRLRRARLKAGWSQQVLGAKLGVSKCTIYRWEHGKAIFGSQVDALLKVLGPYFSDGGVAP